MRIVACAVLAALAGASGAGTASADTPAQAKRVVRAWSARLNAYDNAGVARLFAHPATFAQGGTILRLKTSADIALWHRLLPCAGRIVSIDVEGDRATAVFLLANGKRRHCDAPGVRAAAVFQIRNGKIRTWTQIPVPPEGPAA